MSLFDYFAIQKVLSKELQSSGWKITQEKVREVEDFFRPFVDGKNLVVTPRLASVGEYVSFRYCGLELLHLTSKNTYRLTLEVRDGKIRRAKKAEKVKTLDRVAELLEIVRPILEKSDFASKPRQDRVIPGFSMEHWLESLILADTEGGKRARQHLGINIDLSKVVSQVPVVVKSLNTKRRVLHIDLFSFNDNGKSIIIELKKDFDLGKVIFELVDYVNWFLHNGNKFDRELGNPEEMIREHYMPLGEYDFSQKGVEAIAVVVKSRRVFEWPLKDQVRFKIVELPPFWWSKPDGNPFSL